jgi:DNA replication ATP-dependent helicase Dna2
MPSTQTRTKLKAFQFVAGFPPVETGKEREADKENLPAALGKALPTDAMESVPQAVKDTAKTPRSKPATSKTCPPPSTPAMKRLPLADLVGNIDDSSRHAPQPVVSPEEQLIWRGSQPLNTPLPRKNKRRARSSSPVAPSQEDHALDAAKKDLTTPQADPAMELWSRYTSNKGTPSANKSVAFAHLINESSPRSALAAGSVSGLRRWASCGHEFPTSTRKRRRTHGVFQGEQVHGGDVFGAAPSSEGTILRQPTNSNIASMVQRMKECVSKSQPRISSQMPSSSSPLPDTAERHVQSSGSPLQRRPQGQDVAETSETLGMEDDGVIAYDAAVGDDDAAEDDEQQRCPGSPDEFGDDFDSEMVDAIDAPRHEAEQSIQAVQETSYITIPTDSMPAPPRQQLSAVVQSRDPGSDDEFGMDEFEDDFAADLEHVASLYDSRPTASQSQKRVSPIAEPATRMAAHPPVIDLVDDDDDDEFGDDIDVDVFAAAEVAATQTSANTVRRNLVLR